MITRRLSGPLSRGLSDALTLSKGVLVPPDGFVFQLDADGTYLTDADGVYLTELI